MVVPEAVKAVGVARAAWWLIHSSPRTVGAVASAAMVKVQAAANPSDMAAAVGALPHKSLGASGVAAVAGRRVAAVAVAHLSPQRRQPHR